MDDDRIGMIRLLLIIIVIVIIDYCCYYKEQYTSKPEESENGTINDNLQNFDCIHNDDK